jgi:hypothetical protein
MARIQHHSCKRVLSGHARRRHLLGDPYTLDTVRALRCDIDIPSKSRSVCHQRTAAAASGLAVMSREIVP